MHSPNSSRSPGRLIGADLITSRSNRLVVEAAKLDRARHRHETGLTVVEGPHVVAAAAGHVAFRHLFALEDDAVAPALATAAGAELVFVSRQVLDKVAHTAQPRGPVGVIEIPATPSLEMRPTLVSWGIGDPGNAGTLIRIAAGFGLQSAWGGNAADPWAPKVLRAAAGSHFPALPVGPVTVDMVRDCGLRVVAATVSGGVSPPEIDWNEPAAVFIGSEAHGLPDAVIAAADVAVTIPVEIDSLNAAIAGAILAYAMTR